MLLDILLPKIDGFGVCELIRRSSQVPILMLTALDGEEQQLRGFGLDIDDYVTKPFSMPVLLEKIRVILRRNTGAGGELPALPGSDHAAGRQRGPSGGPSPGANRPGNLNCCTPFWPRRGVCLPGKCCWPSSGAMTFSGTNGWWTATLRTSDISWGGDISRL